MALNGMKLISSNPINALFIFFIRFYQLFLSSFFSGNCRFFPSCSEYSLESFKKFGTIKALKMTFTRLCKCHPFTEGGYDPVESKNNLVLKIISPQKMQKLRELYLYKKKKLAIYAEDNNKSTKHFILYMNNKEVSGLTLIKKIDKRRIKFQIRGMFTVEKLRNKNFGSKLLEIVEKDFVKKNDCIWCNARYDAVKFYKKNGFKKNGNFFLINGIGKHLKMEKNGK